MAQGPSDTILVAIRITLRIRESKVRNPIRIVRIGGGLCSLSIAFLLGYCISIETVFVCLHVRLICALNYYILTYLLTYLVLLTMFSSDLDLGDISRLAHLQCESPLLQSPRLSSAVCLSRVRSRKQLYVRYARNFAAFIGNRGRRARIRSQSLHRN